MNFQSFSASIADAVGCTTFSFAVNLGVWRRADAPRPAKHGADGRPRPQEYECQERLELKKSLSQPWFDPFSSPGVRRWPLALRRHRTGLMHVLRRDVHDRAEIWFVKPDGSNLAECLDDAVAALRRDGLAWFERVRRA